MVTRAAAPEAPDDGGALLPWLEKPLAEALRTQRGHALLVHGPQGVGQFEFAMALARAWLCETPEGEAQRPGGRACGHCAACRLIDAHAHPDLRVLLPEVWQIELGWGNEADEGGERKKTPSKELKVEQVRQALDFSMLTGGRGRGKVVVLHPAEQMNGVAANALLKTLEEPPPGQRFVLSCGAPQGLLPTIRSRCQAVRLPLPERAPALAWLTARGIEGAEALLDACGGQPLHAARLAEAGLDAAAWTALPGAVARGQSAALTGWPVPVLIDALQKLCHDQMLRLQSIAPRYFTALTPIDRPAPERLQAELTRLSAWGAELRRFARHAEHPFNAGLAVEALVQQGQVALRGPAASRGGRRLHSSA